MEHQVVSYNNEEIVIRTDENKLVRVMLGNEQDTVIYSEFINEEWISYPEINVKSLLGVVNHWGVRFEDQVTVDYFTCDFFERWYKNILGK